MENPRYYVAQIPKVVEDRVSTSMEVDVLASIDEASSIPKEAAAVEALDNPCVAPYGVGNSKRVKEIPSGIDYEAKELRKRYSILGSVKMKKRR